MRCTHSGLSTPPKYVCKAYTVEKKAYTVEKKAYTVFLAKNTDMCVGRLKSTYKKNFACGAVKTYILTCFVEIFDIFKKNFACGAMKCE